VAVRVPGKHSARADLPKPQKLHNKPTATSNKRGAGDPEDARQTSIPVPFAAWHALALIAEMLPSRPATPCLPQSEFKTTGQLFDNWFDPIEAGLRDRARGFLQEMLEDARATSNSISTPRAIRCSRR